MFRIALEGHGRKRRKAEEGEGARERIARRGMEDGG